MIANPRGDLGSTCRRLGIQHELGSPFVKVFLSWSGDRSRLVATALNSWLPYVLNDVSPFVSSNIDAGARWQTEIANELEETNFGIVCVTAENQHAPWLNFEAGALAKTVDASRVIPLAINLRPAEIANPLGQFQSQKMDQEGVGKVVSAINRALPKPLSADHINKATGTLWPEFEKYIQAIDQRLDEDLTDRHPRRTDRELIEDILNSIRSMARAGDNILAVPLLGRGAYSRRARSALREHLNQLDAAAEGEITIEMRDENGREWSEAFRGRWLIEPDDANRFGSDAGACYGIAQTATGKIAVYVHHVNDRWPPALRVYNDLDEAQDDLHLDDRALAMAASAMGQHRVIHRDI